MGSEYHPSHLNEENVMEMPFPEKPPFQSAGDNFQKQAFYFYVEVS